MFVFQNFFDNYDDMIHERFMSAGNDLISILEGEEKENVEHSIAALSDKWKVSYLMLRGGGRGEVIV